MILGRGWYTLNLQIISISVALLLKEYFSKHPYDCSVQPGLSTTAQKPDSFYDRMFSFRDS